MVLAAAAAFTGASVQSATGFGFALVLSPALFAALEPLEAVWALLALGLVLNVLVLRDTRRGTCGGRVRWDALRPALIAAVPGLALGALMLALAPRPVLQVVVGVGVVAAAALVWRVPAMPRSGGALTAGLVSGALTTSVSLSGPPLVLWLRARCVTPSELRASLAAAFVFLNAVGAVLLLGAHGAPAADPVLLAGLLALVVAGHLLGARLFRRVDAERFSVLVLALVIAGGLASVAAGLSGL
jgi:uncharacterized protein